MKKKYVLPLVALWAVLTVLAWLGPREALSDTERRPLAQMPPFTAEDLLDGSFMGDFEKFSLDQFPLRDSFRQMKSVFHYFCLGQRDNNGIYISDGSAVKQEYPLNEKSLSHALERFQWLYESYLRDSRVYAAVIPDKGYYLSRGNLAMDYERLFERVREGMPWASHVDLTMTLSGEDYYRTDTHWRQEALMPAAQKLSQAMGVTPPQVSDFTETTVERPFYGVYYGQAALPMKPDTLVLLESDVLENCWVFDYETSQTGPVYDREKLSGKDLYEVFLSGPRSLLTIENPTASTDRELIVFRDSFGSSIVPLLLQDYAKVTLIDIRYIQSNVLSYFVEFKGKDVLFLYSTLVLNNSNTMK